MKKIYVIICAVIVALPIGVQAVKAEQLQFNVRSNYKYVVSIEFYSENRKRAWPGGGKVWLLKDSDVHSYNLNCRRNEKICYGAWSRGNDKNYWGVGKNGRKGCKSCCWTCSGGETPVINLNP